MGINHARQSRAEVVQVMFKDQHGHYVARNPGTVEIVEKEKEG
jgi:hypothetical protein